MLRSPSTFFENNGLARNLLNNKQHIRHQRDGAPQYGKTIIQNPKKGSTHQENASRISSIHGILFRAQKLFSMVFSLGYSNAFSRARESAWIYGARRPLENTAPAIQRPPPWRWRHARKPC
ncbi:hypothetical protein JC796_10150 [Delftia acidovorans]|nr:hypothetical protein [Delftia acidovorans]